MKYMTKQWYQTMQDSGLGVCLRSDERAERSSEELFQTVWEEELAQWLKLRREVTPILKQSFDENEEQALFRKNYDLRLDQFQTRTPPEILERTADVRLLALNVCSQAVSEAFAAFREECKEQVKRTVRAYRAAFEAQGLDAPWLGQFSFHDERVVSWRENGTDQIMDFGPAADGYCPVEKIIFRNARILRQDRPIDGAWWLYEEIYKIGDGYEIHVLLEKEGLIELTLQCDHVEYVTAA